MEVRCFHSLEGASPFESEMEAINRGARRPDPYSTLAYIRTHLAHDEFRPSEEPLEPWLLLAFDGARLAGYLPLRRTWHRVLGRKAAKLEFLVTYDTDRPHLVSRPEDEGRLVVLTDKGRQLVDAAVIDHLENEQRLLGTADVLQRFRIEVRAQRGHGHDRRRIRLVHQQRIFHRCGDAVLVVTEIEAELQVRVE